MLLPAIRHSSRRVLSIHLILCIITQAVCILRHDFSALRLSLLVVLQDSDSGSTLFFFRAPVAWFVYTHFGSVSARANNTGPARMSVHTNANLCQYVRVALYP